MYNLVLGSPNQNVRCRLRDGPRQLCNIEVISQASPRWRTIPRHLVLPTSDQDAVFLYSSEAIAEAAPTIELVVYWRNGQVMIPGSCVC